MRFITISKMAELSGYSEDAIRAKIKRGDWLQDAVFRYAPDGRVLIDVEGYDKWVEGQFQHLALEASRTAASAGRPSPGWW